MESNVTQEWNLENRPQHTIGAANSNIIATINDYLDGSSSSSSTQNTDIGEVKAMD